MLSLPPDLQITISEKLWEYCCVQTRRVSSNSKFHLIHFKYLLQIYYTPSMLYKLGLVGDVRCGHCCAPDAGFLHLAWYCPKIAAYRAAVISVLQEVMEGLGDITPFMALLGYAKDMSKLSRSLINMAILLAKCHTSMVWGQGWHPDLQAGLRI